MKYLVSLGKGCTFRPPFCVLRAFPAVECAPPKLPVVCAVLSAGLQTFSWRGPAARRRAAPINESHGLLRLPFGLRAVLGQRDVPPTPNSLILCHQHTHPPSQNTRPNDHLPPAPVPHPCGLNYSSNAEGCRKNLGVEGATAVHAKWVHVRVISHDAHQRQTRKKEGRQAGWQHTQTHNPHPKLPRCYPTNNVREVRSRQSECGDTGGPWWATFFRPKPFFGGG